MYVVNMCPGLELSLCKSVNNKINNIIFEQNKEYWIIKKFSRLLEYEKD